MKRYNKAFKLLLKHFLSSHLYTENALGILLKKSNCESLKIAQVFKSEVSIWEFLHEGSKWENLPIFFNVWDIFSSGEIISSLGKCFNSHSGVFSHIPKTRIANLSQLRVDWQVIPLIAIYICSTAIIFAGFQKKKKMYRTS